MPASTRRHITVAANPDLYRQTRRLAAQYDTTVTDMLTYLLLLLPDAVKAARYPGGPPQCSGLRLSIPAQDPTSEPTPAASPKQNGHKIP